ncbi:MAG: nucleotidyltransferase domain-containing protein [Paludibacteraceae bacterium]|nr:nucleotidyltransferase domain-containing protein [Paludibacteraceae bacterium]
MPSVEVQKLIPKIRAYFATQPVEKAYLFGSCSRGEETPDSDIDILVTLDYTKPIGLKYFGMICDLEKTLGRKVDLVSDDGLLPFARPYVEKDKILLYERSSL